MTRAEHRPAMKHLLSGELNLPEKVDGGVEAGTPCHRTTDAGLVGVDHGPR